MRGVKTNQGFLLALLNDPDVLAGHTHTTFVDERPDLSAAGPGGDRASRLLKRLAEVTVNHEPATSALAGDPRAKLPAPPAGAPPAGSRQRLLDLGPVAFAAALREQPAIALTDTTLRDAHQSLFATRMRTHDMLAVAPHLAHELPQLLSLEVWGGATFDVALRFLHEDPWDRLVQLRELVPNVCLQMLLRGPEPARLLALSRPRSSARSSPRRSRPASTSSASSTRSTTSRACARRSRRRSRRPRSRRERCATPATSATRASSSTRSTTTCASPSNWSRPASTCSPSRTWPGCCAPPPRAPW